MKALTVIRSTAIAKANRLQKLHPHLATLRPAFRAFLNGHIFVGGRGAYRYRADKSLAPWSDLARSLFPRAEDFAFAAAVMESDALAGNPEPLESPAPAAEKAAGRVNVITLAAA